jgi:hypothetical protein
MDGNVKRQPLVFPSGKTETRMRWAELETGKNSVSPWIKARTTACKKSIDTPERSVKRGEKTATTTQSARKIFAIPT